VSQKRSSVLALPAYPPNISIAEESVTFSGGKQPRGKTHGSPCEFLPRTYVGITAYTTASVRCFSRVFPFFFVVSTSRLDREMRLLANSSRVAERLPSFSGMHLHRTSKRRRRRKRINRVRMETETTTTEWGLSVIE